MPGEGKTIMKWQRLQELPVEGFLSAKLKREVKDLNASIQAQLKNRAEYDSKAAAQRSASLEDFDFDNSTGPGGFLSWRVQILRNEMELRRRFDALGDEIHVERQKAVDVAFETYQQAERDVRKALVSIGYVDADKHENTIGKITPPMIWCHPKVHEAREGHRSLQARASDRPAKRENLKSIKALETELTDIRDSVAVVA